MSFCISFQDFKKMAEKECLKQTGLPLENFPNFFCEDFWPLDFDENLSVQTAKRIVSSFISSIIEEMNRV